MQHGHAHDGPPGTVIAVGSANLDLVYRVDRLPKPGETLLATGVGQHEGGKGNNAVIAAARAGASASFIASVGGDAAGDRITRTLAAAGVRDLLRRVAVPTGTALITVDGSGENTIVVDSGANALLTDLTSHERAAIAEADVLLLQLEVPLDTVQDAAAAATASGTRVVLNAAPARELPDRLLDRVDVLVVNEHEGLLLTDCSPDASGEQVATALLRRVPAVVVTLGPDGAVAAERGSAPVRIPPRRVDAIDSTGAGDTFCGALAAALAAGADLADASEFASIAAAISVTREGAVPSIPDRAEIESFGATVGE